MLKKYKWTMVVTSLVTLLPILLGLLLWNRLPEKIATHWNAAGEPDGWSGKAFAVFAMPLIFLAIHWICFLVTGLDPRNKEQTHKAMHLTLWIVPVLSLMVGGLIYLTAMGREIRVELLMPVFMGVLFLVVGNYLPKCRRNSTIGIKLPWTLGSDENWNATHRLAGKVWTAGSVLILACICLPGEITVFVTLAATLAMVAIPTVYSYLFYRKHEK